MYLEPIWKIIFEKNKWIIQIKHMYQNWDWNCIPEDSEGLAHTEIRIQINILRKASDCFANFIIYM